MLENVKTTHGIDDRHTNDFAALSYEWTPWLAGQRYNDGAIIGMSGAIPLVNRWYKRKPAAKVVAAMRAAKAAGVGSPIGYIVRVLDNER